MYDILIVCYLNDFGLVTLQILALKIENVVNLGLIASWSHKSPFCRLLLYGQSMMQFYCNFFPSTRPRVGWFEWISESNQNNIRQHTLVSTAKQITQGRFTPKPEASLQLLNWLLYHQSLNKSKWTQRTNKKHKTHPIRRKGSNARWHRCRTCTAGSPIDWQLTLGKDSFSGH